MMHWTHGLDGLHPIAVPHGAAFRVQFLDQQEEASAEDDALAVEAKERLLFIRPDGKELWTNEESIGMDWIGEPTTQLTLF
jgi:hypothetical protein